jgi:hypothetical protein
MSGSATHPNSTKRARTGKRKDTNATTNGFAVGGGSATPTPTNEIAGNTKNEPKTTSPLQAALVSSKKGISSLPPVSQPFLTPLCEKIFSTGAAYFYYNDKVTEMKTIPNHVASSARKLNIELQSETGIQKSQAFMTLRDELAAELDKIRIAITRDYITKAAELTLGAKKEKYHDAFCQFIRQVAQTFIAQYDTKNYTEDQAIIDIITYREDDLLNPFKMTLKEFLLQYKKTHNLHVIPHPTVAIEHFTSSIEMIYNAVNNVVAPPSATATTPPNTTTTTTAASSTCTTLVVNPYTANASMDETKDDDDNDPDNIISGGRHHIARETFNTIVKTVIDPLEEFHTQRYKNDESKRIKSKLINISHNAAATRIATVLGNDPPSSQPILRGLVEETTMKKYESRIKSLEDRLSTSSSKKVKGDGTKLKSILRKGASIAVKTNASQAKPKSETKKSSASKKKSSSSSNNRDANNNGTASARGRSPKVSFKVKRSTTRINSRK